ncbi:MAG: hypothetical protein PVH77_00750 [Phycisphaerales bacterium]
MRKKFIIGAIFWGGVVSLVLGIGLVQVYLSAMDSTEDFIKDRIRKEFKDPRIRETVSNVASENAEYLMREEIAPEVEKFKEEMQDALEQSMKLSQNAKEQFDQLKSIIELEDAARFGSRKAYLSLKNIASVQSPFAAMAKRRVYTIERELLSYSSVPGVRFNLSISRKDEKIEADKLSTFELFQHLQSPNFPQNHIPSMMSHISDKPKNEICESAKDILEHSDSLTACAATCGILRKILGDKAPFLAFEQWAKICEEELGN